jgi:hypothetical protein
MRLRLRVLAVTIGEAFGWRERVAAGWEVYAIAATTNLANQHTMIRRMFSSVPGGTLSLV